MTKRTLRMHFAPNELVLLEDALESIIEEFKYDGGLLLAEDYMALQNRVRERMGLSRAWNLPLTESSPSVSAGRGDGG